MKFFLVLGVWLAISTAGVVFMTGHTPGPYMDEIFHVPQAQRYCNGSFEEWDPMITTLPGLYLFSVGITKPVTALLSVPITDWCNVLTLRMTNAIFSACNLYILYQIISKLNRNHSEDTVILKAVTLSLMPLLYFFTYMYYTDQGSTFFILYAYYYYLCGSYATSAILGMVALIFRQTNIIWVFFMALCNVCRNLHRQLEKRGSDGFSPPTLIIDTIANCWSYAIVGVTAVAFVIWNGSIVVGDKSAHQACFHAAQLGYFSLFTLSLAVPHLVTLTKLYRFMSWVLKNKILVILLIIVSCLLVANFTFEHPYLLADNRHYTFYIWSKLFRRFELLRFALIPVYLFAIWSVADSLTHVSSMVLASLALCVSAAIVPQRLMEFRYFIIPYLLIRLHIKDECRMRLLAELTVYLAINAFTFHRFLYKPIFWPNISDHQRIMW